MTARLLLLSTALMPPAPYCSGEEHFRTGKKEATCLSQPCGQVAADEVLQLSDVRHEEVHQHRAIARG